VQRTGSGGWWRCSTPRSRWTQPSSAPETPDLSELARVRVTHPFHSLVGQELEFVKRRKNWRADRVYFYGSAGGLASLPAEWADVVVAHGILTIQQRRVLRRRVGGMMLRAIT